MCRCDLFCIAYVWNGSVLPMGHGVLNLVRNQLALSEVVIHDDDDDVGFMSYLGSCSELPCFNDF